MIGRIKIKTCRSKKNLYNLSADAQAMADKEQAQAEAEKIREKVSSFAEAMEDKRKIAEGN